MRKLQSSFLVLIALFSFFSIATKNAPQAFANCEDFGWSVSAPQLGGKAYDMRDENNPIPVENVGFRYGMFDHQLNGWYDNDIQYTNSSGSWNRGTGQGDPVNDQGCENQLYSIEWYSNPDGYIGWIPKTIGHQILGGADQEFGTNPRPQFAPLTDMGWTFDYGINANTPFNQLTGYYNQREYSADCSDGIYSDNGTGYQGWIDRPILRCNFGLYPYQVQGRVVDNNGNGVNGVVVHVTTAGDVTTGTDGRGDGYFTSTPSLAPNGYYDVSVSVPNGYAYARTVGGGWTWSYTDNRDTTSSDSYYKTMRFGSGNDCAGPGNGAGYGRCNFTLTIARAPQIESVDVFDQTRVNRVANGGMVGSSTNNPLDVTLNATKGTYTPTEMQAFLYSGSTAASDSNIGTDALTAIRLRYASGHYYVYSSGGWINVDNFTAGGYPVCGPSKATNGSGNRCPRDPSQYLLYTARPRSADLSSDNPYIQFQIQFDTNFGSKTLHIGGEILGGQDAGGSELKDFEGSLSH